MAAYLQGSDHEVNPKRFADYARKWIRMLWDHVQLSIRRTRKGQTIGNVFHIWPSSNGLELYHKIRNLMNFIKLKDSINLGNIKIRSNCIF